MKNLLVTTAIAVCLAAPALAQTTVGPVPVRNFSVWPNWGHGICIGGTTALDCTWVWELFSAPHDSTVETTGVMGCPVTVEYSRANDGNNYIVHLDRIPPCLPQ